MRLIGSSIFQTRVERTQKYIYMCSPDQAICFSTVLHDNSLFCYLCMAPVNPKLYLKKQKNYTLQPNSECDHISVRVCDVLEVSVSSECAESFINYYIFSQQYDFRTKKRTPIYLACIYNVPYIRIKAYR